MECIHDVQQNIISENDSREMVDIMFKAVLLFYMLGFCY